MHVSGNMPCVACGNVLAIKITAEVAFVLQIDVKWAAQHLSSTGGTARPGFIELGMTWCCFTGRVVAANGLDAWPNHGTPACFLGHAKPKGTSSRMATTTVQLDICIPVSQIYTFDRKTGFLFPIRSEKRFPTSFIKFRSKFKISGKLLKYK